MKLDIGCGNKKKSGYTGVDISSCYNPDILCDVNKGLPLFSNTVKTIHMDNSLEHFINPIFVLKECYRVLKKQGTIEIIIPNCQWLPLLLLGMFVDIHWFWNKWMSAKKNRGLHYSMWTPYTLVLLLEQTGFTIANKKGYYCGKQYYVKAIK